MLEPMTMPTMMLTASHSPSRAGTASLPSRAISMPAPPPRTRIDPRLVVIARRPSRQGGVGRRPAGRKRGRGERGREWDGGWDSVGGARLAVGGLLADDRLDFAQLLLDLAQLALDLTQLALQLLHLLAGLADQVFRLLRHLGTLLGELLRALGHLEDLRQHLE